MAILPLATNLTCHQMVYGLWTLLTRCETRYAVFEKAGKVAREGGQYSAMSLRLRPKPPEALSTINAS